MSRSVIERQVLVTLANDHSKVAILADKDNLDTFISAFETALLFSSNGRLPDKWRELKLGLEQLRSEAFE